MAGEYDQIDIPPIAPLTERHRRLSCACPCCGVRTKAAVPEAASGSPFGPNIQSLAFYLKHLQHVSYQRLEAMFRDVFGLTISQGAFGNLFRRGGKAFAAEKAGILATLRQAQAVASDETGLRIEGINAQHWVFRSADTVLHEVAFSRGAQVVRDVMGGHRPTFWTSDHYSAQQGHGERQQACLAHLARDTAYAVEASEEMTPYWLKLWIADVFALWRGIEGYASRTVARKRRELENRLAALLQTPSNCDITRALLKKISNAREQLLIFIDAPGLV